MQPRPLRLIPVSPSLRPPSASAAGARRGRLQLQRRIHAVLQHRHRAGGSAPPRPTYNPYPCNGYTCSYYDNYDPGLYLDFGRGGGISIGGGRN